MWRRAHLSVWRDATEPPGITTASGRVGVGVGRALSVIAIAAGARYLWWRLGTLDGTGVAGVAFLGIELVSFAGLIVITAVLHRSRWREGPPAPPTGTLDVFVTVCGEPVDMVERTLIAAIAIDHPHRTYVLNDGRLARKPGWEEIDALAARLGVTCLSRTTGGRGKAANLNHALAHTDGEFVATIDADHIAHADLAGQTLGYFTDPDVAFVSSLQSFASDDHDTLNNEERFFYRSLQPAKDADDCAISCGNGTVYRRTALQHIAGFSEWNLVEDLHTSYRLHGAGWKSVYHPRSLTHGTAPLTAAEYLNQRLQWATDSLRLLFFDSPLRKKGLSWRHRLHYFHTTSSYLFTATQTAFIVAPSLYLLWGISVVNADSVPQYLSYTVPFLLATALFLVAHTGIRGAVRTVQSALFAAPVYLFAFFKATTGVKFKSRVTNKQRQRRFSVLMLPQAVGFALAAAAVVLALGGGPRNSVVALFWCGYVGFQFAGPLLALTERELVTRSARQVVRFGVVSVTVPALLVGAINRPPAALASGPMGPTVGPAIDSTSAPSGPERLLPPERGAYFGVANPELVTGPAHIEDWVTRNGHQPQIIQWFQQWWSNETRFRGDWLDTVAAEGAVPMITWEPWAKPEDAYADPNQPEAQLHHIVAGAYDDYVGEWATAAAAYRRPIIIRLMQEMNGTWYPWSGTVNGNTPELFVEAWRHIHDLFASAGATNVSWVWSPYVASELPDSVDPLLLYPGPEYVDWVAVSGFNWGTAEQGSSWRAPDELFGSSYDTFSSLGKPMMISEIGSVDVGGDAATWLRESVTSFEQTYPLVKAVVWFDATYDAESDFRLAGALSESVQQAVGASPYWTVDPYVVRPGERTPVMHGPR